MNRWMRPKSSRSLAVLAVGSVLLVTLAGEGAARAALNLCPGDPACGGPCSSDADCNCDSTQQAGGCASGTGAGGSCVVGAGGVGVDLCFCNPGYSPPACASGACCSPDGSCRETGQIICEDGGTYQGDNVSCTAVTCPQACEFSGAPECGGSCPPGQVCTPILLGANDGLQATGRTTAGECGCVTPPDTPTPTNTPTSTTTNTPTITPTSTETSTPTNTPVMMGGPCEETTDCEGGLVCEAGICTENTAPAPIASERGVFVIIGLLLSVGAFAIFRRRRSA